MQLQNTALTARAGQTKPHMHRDALPKAHPKIMGNLKNSAERATQGKPRQTVITGARRKGFLAGFSWRIPLISKVVIRLSCNFQSEFTELYGPN